MNEDLSSETLAGDAQLTSADGGETVDSPALTLAELNTFLGSNYKDTETALKSLKDTKDFVGKRKEDIAKAVVPTPTDGDDVKAQVQSLREDLFYSKNPQFEEYKDLLRKIGGNPAEAVESTEFKKLFEKAVEADKSKESKSVVGSNSRLSQTKSVRDNAVQIANARGSTNEDVAMAFARGIIEAQEE